MVYYQHQINNEVKYLFKRLFFKYYKFYSNLDSDDFMRYYYSAFALSLIVSFFLFAFCGFLNKMFNVKFISTSGTSLSIFFFIIVITGLVLFYRNKTDILKSIDSMNNKFEKFDILIWLFTIFGFISLFIGGIWLSN
mgnify:CR=1 FL=1